MKVLLGFLIPLFSVSCAYQWGLSERRMPGGYKQVTVPMFKNKSQEVGAEADFTNALVQKIELSQVADLSSRSDAPLLLDGTIVKIDIVRGLGASSQRNLPDRAILSAEYRIVAVAHINLIRQSDQKVIWTGAFSAEKAYPAPRIGTEVVNSADAVYNQSARRDVIRQLADEIMTEAHDRMTENF